MKKETYKYAVVVFMNNSKEEHIKYVTSLEDGNYAKWEPGQKALLFDSAQTARDIAFGLSVNGNPAAVVEVPDYLNLENHPEASPCDGPVCPDDITGCLGEWIEKGFGDEVPSKAVESLKAAYSSCRNALSGTDEKETEKMVVLKNGTVEPYDEAKALFMAQPDDFRWEYNNSFEEYIYRSHGICIDRIYTPNEYIRTFITPFPQEMDEDMSIETFDKKIADKYCLWNYPLNEIDYVLVEKKKVVYVLFSDGVRLVEIPEA